MTGRITAGITTDRQIVYHAIYVFHCWEETRQIGLALPDSMSGLGGDTVMGGTVGSVARDMIG
jgi:hypothetical protein